MLKEFEDRKKFLKSCNELVLRLESQDLNENLASDFINKLFDNAKTIKEIADFYQKLLTNNEALKSYLSSLIATVKNNISSINNPYLNKFLQKLNGTPNLKNLIFLSALTCLTSYYILAYTKIPDLGIWLDKILQSQLLNNTNFNTLIEFIGYLVKIVGSVFFIYKVLIDPYKDEIMGMVGGLNLSKVSLKRKQPITESHLKNIIRKELLNYYNSKL